MNILNESQPAFRKIIGTILNNSAPDYAHIDLKKLATELPITLRELAYVVAICEGRYSYKDIPWEKSSFREKVDVIHNIFLKRMYKKEIKVEVEMAFELEHDYSGKAIPSYKIFPVDSNPESILINLLSSLNCVFHF